jgi:catalase
MRAAWFSLAFTGLADSAATVAGVSCPFASSSNGQSINSNTNSANMMVDAITPATNLPVYMNDTNSYMTTDWGTPIQDQLSLKVGPSGPTVLEDFMFRQKLQRFDHERVS